MSGLTIANNIPAIVLAISSEILEKRDALVARAGIYADGIKDAESFAIADQINAEIIAIDKLIEGERKLRKAPLLALVQAFDDAFADARTPLVTTKTALSKAVVSYRDAENKRIAEEHARKVREAEELRQAELKRQQEAEAARLAALPQSSGSANDDAPPPWEEPARETKVHDAVIVPPPPPPQLVRSGSVKTVSKKVLVIDDPNLIPRTLGEAVLMVPDKAAITACLKAKQTVPGCRLVDDTSISAKG